MPWSWEECFCSCSWFPPGEVAGGSRRGKSPGKDGRLPGSLHPQPPMALAGRGHPHVRVSLERLSSGRRKSGFPLLHLLPAPGSSLRLHLLAQQHPGHRPKGDALALERLPPRLHPPAPRPSCMAQVPRLPLPACRRRLVLLPCGQPIHQLLPPPPRPTPPPATAFCLVLHITGRLCRLCHPHHWKEPTLEVHHTGTGTLLPRKPPRGRLLFFSSHTDGPLRTELLPLAHQGYAIQHLQIPGGTECLPLLQETINPISPR